jgi:opacity protein-like surface antigen
MKKTVITLALALVLAPAVASADSIIGAQLQIVPGGEIDTEAFGIGVNGDLETAYGLAVIGEYVVHRHVTVGLAPRVVFGIKFDEDADDSSTQLDIPIRVTGRLFFGKLAVHGYVSPAYSIIFVPDPSEDIDVDNPAGFAIGFGAGVAYQLNNDLALSAELGYTAGSQSVELEGPLGDETVDVATSLPHIAIGIHTAF